MIIDQLPALASPQDTDEIPIERGQLAYKIPWSNLAGEAIANLQSDVSDLQTDITDAQGDIAVLNAALNNAILEGAEQTITASTNGTSAWISLPGLTENHKVGNWGMRTSTDPIPENSPPCDIEIEKGTDQWRYTLMNNSTAFYLKPTFILPQN